MPSRDTKRWRHWETSRTEREIRKQIKPNRQPRRPRPHDWSWDEMDSADVPQRERVMPKGEQERRKAVLKTVQATVNDDDGQGKVDLDSGSGSLLPGTVVSVSTGLCQVDTAGGQLLCSLRGTLTARMTGFTNVVAVGDRVLLSPAAAGEAVVERVMPRTSVLARPDVFYDHLDQVIVANADQLLIVAAWRDPIIWLELVDRLVISAERNGLDPILCVNKMDLAADPGEPHRLLQPYRELGLEILFTSALTGAGIAELRQWLRGKTTALAGLSGVGKSSLLAAVQPGLQLRVGAISDDTHQGRHTTTQVSLLRLQGGGYVVDTPGIKEFGLRGLSRAELVHYFPEIAAAGRRCRFGDCSHSHEPDCAVRAALEGGAISADRYHSFRVIYEDLKP